MLNVPHAQQLDDIDFEIAKDNTLHRIKETLKQGLPTKHEYTLVQGQLFYKNKLVLPVRSSFIPLILHECHDSLVGGHWGVLKTLKRVLTSLYWEGMKRTIQNYVAKCTVCQQNKYSTVALGGYCSRYLSRFKVGNIYL